MNNLLLFPFKLQNTFTKKTYTQGKIKTMKGGNKKMQNRYDR